MPKFVKPEIEKKFVPKFEPPKFLIDPFYNPWKDNVFKRTNLSRIIHNAKLKSIKLPPPGENLPRVLHYCADQGGCAFWRLIFPGNELLANNKAVVQTMYQMLADPSVYNGLSAIRLQRQCSDIQLDFIKHLRNISDSFKQQGKEGFKIIYEVDDLISNSEITDFNLCKAGFTDPKIVENVKNVIQYCHEMVVPSQYMADYYRKLLNYDKISVIPNYVPKYWFDKGVTVEHSVNRYIKNKEKPRILYAGSSTHFDVANLNGMVDDFYHVNDVILRDIEIDKKYQWIFVGGYPYRLKKYVDDKTIKYHNWTSMTEYPSLLNSTDAQIMLAPLMNNSFNKAKANIKLTEGAALGIPTVAQNLECYNSDGWKYLFTTGEQMMEQITAILASEDSYRSAVTNAKQYVDRYWLGDHLDEWTKLYTTPYGDSSRKELTDFYERNKKQFE
jgi:hypothetical protein